MIFHLDASGYWVVTTSSPRIASQDAPDGKSQSLDRPMFQDSLSGIFATGGLEPAGGTE